MKTIVVLALLLGSSITWAHTDIDRSGYYVGGKFGRVDTALGVQTNTWTINGGYNFNQYIGTEISYISGVKFRFDGVDFDADDGFQFAIIPTLPINDDWSLTARLGYTYIKYDYDIDNSYSESGLVNEFIWGVGLVRHIGQTFIKVEYEDLVGSDFVTIGFGVRF